MSVLDAVHLSSFEQPEAFAQIVSEFKKAFDRES
jgi:hypothetical protein